MNTLGKFIKEKRNSNNLSLTEASSLSGIPQTHISDIEYGRIIPSFQVILVFIKIYKVSMKDFLRETDYLTADIEPAHMREKQSLPKFPLSQASNWQTNNDNAKTATPFNELTSVETLKLIEELPGSTPLIIDLDETLVLQSTTDGFLGSAWPSVAVVILLALLDRLRPWRITGGDETSDWFRILVIAMVMPWSLIRWHLLSRSWTSRWANTALIEVVLSHKGPVTVATRGFEPIVKPVLTALGLHHAELVACRLGHPRDRLRTKTTLLRLSGVADRLKSAVVVTDSEDDRDLLSNAAIGCLTRWPGADWSDPFRDVYVPFRYTERVKNPCARFVLDAWLADDYIAILLAFTWTASQPVIHGLGLAALMIAFWITYEIGYHENDILGSTSEAEPQLSEAFTRGEFIMPRWAPWCWAAAITIVGACLLTASTDALHPLTTTIVIWLLILVVTRATFAVFNRLPKPFRIFPHAVLQFEKFASLALLTATTPIGVLTLASQCLYRWAPYVWYRLEPGRKFPEVHTVTFRLAVALIGLIVLACFNTETAVSWHAAVVLGWFTLRSRRALTSLVCRVQR